MREESDANSDRWSPNLDGLGIPLETVRTMPSSPEYVGKGTMVANDPTAGVYHPLESPTQTSEDAKKQEATAEIWGHPSVWSDIPKVKAYSGHLPPGKRGIEFRTVVPPDRGGAPGRPEWSGPRDGVSGEHGIARLTCKVTKNTQT